MGSCDQGLGKRVLGAYSIIAGRLEIIVVLSGCIN
jgi:hypothetical protein